MKQKKHKVLFKLSPVGVLCAMIAAPMPLIAQTTEDEIQQIDEIVVTGRKREETLQEIPVSISVLSADTLAEQNVLSQDDLAELIPGLTYNQGNGRIDDRIAALPSIRGVSSNEIATNRSKVSSFIDGIPILGSVGAINIGGASQVEVYSGPQSAAFGRSTFAGAINYVTVDPADELGGSVGVNWSNEGTRIINGSFSGPISDTLGFHLGGQYEDSEAPDDFYTYSDGVEASTRGGVNASARFVFTPSDNFRAKLTFTHDETDDGPTANFYATQQSSLDCYNSLSDIYEAEDMMATTIGTFGEFDCEFDRDTNAGLFRVNDITRYYDQNPDEFQAVVDAAIAAGASADTAADDIAFLADAFSVPHEDVGSQSERQRVLAQFDYFTDNDSIIQFSYMKGSEDYVRRGATYSSATPYAITYSAATDETIDMGVVTAAQPERYVYEGVDDAMGMNLTEADPTTIDEEYVELRWASPGSERARYVAGASYYEYDFETLIYRSGIFNAVEDGTADRVIELLADPDPDVLGSDVDTILGEQTKNLAAFFNVSYDFTDKITGSLEGRYSSDDVGASSLTASASQKTTSFAPRVALNYNVDENTTYYVQYAIGINPAGVSSDMLDQDLIDELDKGFTRIIDIDGTEVEFNNLSDPDGERTVGYSSDDFLFYDEETITNFEFGFKGTAFDDRLSYNGAVYHMIWEDAVQNINLNWEYQYADADRFELNADPLNPTELVDFEDLLPQDQDRLGELVYTDTLVNGGARVSANQGTVHTTGLELQGNFRINENWTIGGNTSIMNARYEEFCSNNIWGSDTSEPDETDLGFLAGLDQGVDENGLDCWVLDGNKLANQPSFTLSLTPRYSTEFNNGIRLNATARIQHESTSYLNDTNVGENPSTQTLNLTLGLSKGALSANFYMNNVLGEEGNTGTSVEAADYEEDFGVGTTDPDLYFGSANQFSSFTYRIPSVRTYGMRLNYSF